LSKTSSLVVAFSSSLKLIVFLIVLALAVFATLVDLALAFTTFANSILTFAVSADSVLAFAATIVGVVVVETPALALVA